MADKVSAQIVDFSNVKDGGNFNKKRIPAGDYLATVSKVQDAEAKDGVFQYLFTIKIKSHADRAFPYYCKLQENQLWKLRNLLVAAGINVPKKRMKLDPTKVVGKTIGVTVDDAEYEGKLQSEIASIFPASELADQPDIPVEEVTEEPDEDEEVEEAEAEEDDAGDQFDAMDRTALKAFLVKADPSFKAKKSQDDDALRELARAVKPAAAEDDEDDELEELDISDV